VQRPIRQPRWIRDVHDSPHPAYRKPDPKSVPIECVAREPFSCGFRIRESAS
jgi:hypothetical protein